MSDEKQPLQKLSCGRCGHFLAIKEKREISVRLKDRYFYFIGGLMLLVCRQCGAQNCFSDEQFERENPDLVKRYDNRASSFRARLEDWKSHKQMELLKQKGEKALCITSPQEH